MDKICWQNEKMNDQELMGLTLVIFQNWLLLMQALHILKDPYAYPKL